MKETLTEREKALRAVIKQAEQIKKRRENDAFLKEFYRKNTNVAY